MHSCEYLLRKDGKGSSSSDIVKYSGELIFATVYFDFIASTQDEKFKGHYLIINNVPIRTLVATRRLT